MFRRGLLQFFNYYLIMATSVIFFLCISSLNFLFDGNFADKLAKSYYDKPGLSNGIILIALLAYQLFGLFLIIGFKRRQMVLKAPLFFLLAVLFFIVFILPSLLFFVTGLSMFSNT